MWGFLVVVRRRFVDKLVNDYGVGPERLHAFGAVMYALVARNRSEKGRTQNRPVELVER